MISNLKIFKIIFLLLVISAASFFVFLFSSAPASACTNQPMSYSLPPSTMLFNIKPGQSYLVPSGAFITNNDTADCASRNFSIGVTPNPLPAGWTGTWSGLSNVTIAPGATWTFGSYSLSAALSVSLGLYTFNLMYTDSIFSPLGVGYQFTVNVSDEFYLVTALTNDILVPPTGSGSNVIEVYGWNTNTNVVADDVTPVTFSLSGLPPGATYSFTPYLSSPSPCIPLSTGPLGGGCARTLTINTSSVALGTYYLMETVTNGYNSHLVNFSLVVSNSPPPPPPPPFLCTLSASPSSIASGDTATLSWWTTTNAASASIDQGIGSVTPVAAGNRTVTPAITTTYTMMATGISGLTTTCQTTINVSPLSCPTGGLVPCGRICDDPSTPEIDESEPCGVCAGFYMLRKTIDFVLPLAVEAAIFFLIVAGLLYAFSGGDVRKAGMARSATTGAIYGLVFAFLAWLIISAGLHILGYINFGDWNHTSCVLPTKIIYTEATVPVNCNGPVPNFHNDDCVYFTDAKIYKSDSEKNLPDTVKVELGPNVFNQYGNMEILSPKGDVIATLKSSNSENMDCTRNTSPCPPAGDVNSDGLVNDVDVAWIADYLAGLRMFLVPQFTAADADGNGNVNAVDEQLVKDYIAGVASTFPVCASGHYTSIPECPHSSSSGYYDAYFTPNLSCGFYLNCPVTIEANAMLDVLNSSPPPNYFTVADDACWRLYDPMLIMRYSKDFTGNDSTTVPSFTADMTGIWNINLYKGHCASLNLSSVPQCYNAQYYAPPNPVYNWSKGVIPGQDITSLFNDGPGIYTVRVNAFSNCKNSVRSAAADLNVTIAHRL